MVVFSGMDSRGGNDGAGLEKIRGFDKKGISKGMYKDKERKSAIKDNLKSVRISFY